MTDKAVYVVPGPVIFANLAAVYGMKSHNVVHHPCVDHVADLANHIVMLLTDMRVYVGRTLLTMLAHAVIAPLVTFEVLRRQYHTAARANGK